MSASLPANRQEISNFSFWQPVAFEDKTPTGSQVTDYLWKLGSLADRFAYLGSTQSNVTSEQINIRKFSFEVDHETNIPLMETVLKVALFVASAFILPAIALVIKAAFKWKLNSITMLKENPNIFLEGKEIGKTRVVLVTGDLLAETTEATVNAANARLAAGAGVCGAFHQEAGDGIFDECEEILTAQGRNAVDTGEAVLTTAGDLAPRITAIVHAVGPIYDTKKADKDPAYVKKQHDLLAKAYTSSLELATEPLFHQAFISPRIKNPQPLRTIAFPSISTGIYDFPLPTAAKIALESVKTFIEKNPTALDEVRFVFLPMVRKEKTASYYVTALNNL